MESTLHRELKNLYAGTAAQCEVRLGSFRIDAVLDDGSLVEIQHGSLSAIRRKLEKLLAADHRVLLVKPIVSRKRIVWMAGRGGAEKSRRWSPKRGGFLDLFQEMIYITSVFPHARLAIEVPLVEIEERRIAMQARRRRRRFARAYRVAEQRLMRVVQTRRFCQNADLMALLPADLPQPFHTAHLAHLLTVNRWLAQRMAYCLRSTGALKVCGKQGNAWLYEFAERAA